MMQKKTGFNRLRSTTAAGVIGMAGLFGAGSAARAASTGIPLDVARAGVEWIDIDNNSISASSTTTNGFDFTTSTPAFGISEGIIIGTPSFRDAFDNALTLAVGSNFVDGNFFVNPDGTVDLTGDTVTSDVVTDIIAGIDARIQYHFFPTRPLVRALFSLTNTTGAPIAVDPVVLSNYGSDDDTTVRASSDGDTTIEMSDFWYITDEDDDDPRITTTRYCAGAEVVPFNALTPGTAGPQGNEDFGGLRYPATIAPGETARILVFMELTDPTLAPASAIADAADFESLPALQAAGLMTGLSETEIAEIINCGASVQPPAGIPTLSATGLAGLIGLLGGAYFFALRGHGRHRRRQEKTSD